MKFKVLIVLVIGLTIFLLYSCLNQNQKGERIARQHCGSCHLFPEPKLLDKKTWDKVFPEMAFRMGMDLSLLSKLSSEDQAEVILTLPGQPMVSEEDWEAIKNYYATNAPDTLEAPVQTITTSIKQFNAEPYFLGGLPTITFVKVDTVGKKIYVGSRLEKLYQLNDRLIAEDSFELSSPPSHISFSGSGRVTLSLMGIMDPNDQAKGEILSLDLKDRSVSHLIDSLKRPVYFESTDLDNDDLEDMIVCAFGNYTGALLAFKNRGDGNFERRVLQSLPGARKVIVRDFDGNGINDILALMSQGEEKIILLLNQGNFEFRLSTLLSFPPVFGSSYFDIVDFNNDGKFDILYTNGDNADYSTIPKPYHGVRIFLNNGKNEFKESWSFNMHGASQAVASDFDNDGDLDIAAISFFPDFKNHAEQGFIYFENSGTGFTPQVTPLAADGRWLTIEASDVDFDGDRDIMLGALDFNNGVPTDVVDKWKKKPTAILLLRNTLK